MSGPESEVLPLHHSSISPLDGAKIEKNLLLSKGFFDFFLLGRGWEILGGAESNWEELGGTGRN